MNKLNSYNFTTSPLSQPTRKLHRLDNLALRSREPKIRRLGEIYNRRNLIKKYSEISEVKELDAETGLYYYGARYLDPRTSRWLSGDPAMGEYVPSPGQDPSKLGGMGGVYNTVNLHTYHYGANNPIKYIDPDGRDVVVFSERLRRAINYLYNNSNVFRSSYDNILRQTNSLGERLIVFIAEGTADYPGSMKTDSDFTTTSVPSTFALDNRGYYVTGSVEEGEWIQFISITIDTGKIDSRNINLLEPLIEEIMHAEDAARMGSTAFNEAAERERRDYRYGEGPIEGRAKDRIQVVLWEVQQ